MRCSACPVGSWCGAVWRSRSSDSRPRRERSNVSFREVASLRDSPSLRNRVPLRGGVPSCASREKLHILGLPSDHHSPAWLGLLMASITLRRRSVLANGDFDRPATPRPGRPCRFRGTRRRAEPISTAGSMRGEVITVALRGVRSDSSTASSSWTAGPTGTRTTISAHVTGPPARLGRVSWAGIAGDHWCSLPPRSATLCRGSLQSAAWPHLLIALESRRPLNRGSASPGVAAATIHARPCRCFT